MSSLYLTALFPSHRQISSCSLLPAGRHSWINNFPLHTWLSLLKLWKAVALRPDFGNKQPKKKGELTQHRGGNIVRNDSSDEISSSRSTMIPHIYPLSSPLSFLPCLHVLLSNTSAHLEKKLIFMRHCTPTEIWWTPKPSWDDTDSRALTGPQQQDVLH